MADMRPSWPPPMMPIAAPRGKRRAHASVLGFRPPPRSGLRDTRVEPCGQCRYRRRLRMAGGEQSGVDGAGAADGQRPHRNTGGHLHDGEQAIHAGQGVAFHGHAQHRHAASRRRHMPGRWAAPPAPAMITFSPRSHGRCGHMSASRSGVRWAETMRVSWRIRRARSASRRHVFIVVQSDWLPMMIPTRRPCLGGGLASGDVVRDQVALKPGDFVLQQQLALFSAAALAIGRSAVTGPGGR